MSLYGARVEYGLHCILYLIGQPQDMAPSSRDIATFQDISPSYTAKLFTQMEKAGLVVSAEGINGGYRLARPAQDITVLDVVDALEPDNALFQCRDVRHGCALFGKTPPTWATHGTCAIHATMLRAENHMRKQLAATTLADIAGAASQKIPESFYASAQTWFRNRKKSRKSPSHTGDDQ